MTKQDQTLLEEAYSAITKKTNDVEQNSALDITDTSPVSEPAPNVQVGAAEVVDLEPKPELTDDIVNVSQEISPENNEEAETEEEQMVIDNLHSIRESIMKTASFCASGGHLEPWQQQKLAIAMDNLAAIARSLRSGAHC